MNQGRTDLLRRLSVMNRLIARVGDCGKIKVQKLTYFLQETENVTLQYKFRMHHYGPYAEEIEDVLGILKMLGYIDIRPDPDGYGFHIAGIVGQDDFLEGESKQYEEQIQKVIERFGSLDAGSLELYATLHFVHNLLPKPSKHDVLQVASVLKPRFPQKVIVDSYESLKEFGYITR